MLFRKQIEPNCAYCSHSRDMDDTMLACDREGIVPAGHACKRFVYDPLRRVPPKPLEPDFSEFDEEDFSL